jgi:hypothetical protein
VGHLLTPSEFRQSNNLSVDNLDLECAFTAGAITAEELRAGVYTGAKWWTFLINWQDPIGCGIIKLGYGIIGEKEIRVLDKNGKLDKTKSRHLRMYDFRHRFVTNALEEGADMKALSEVVGSRPETLMRFYQHVARAVHRQTVEKIHMPPPPAQPAKNKTDKVVPITRRAKR